MAEQKNILMFLIVQTFLVTVEMFADPSLYYSDVDEYEYHVKYTALDPHCILAFEELNTWGQILWCLPHEQIL